jgi:hypothetical protein
MWNAGIIHTRYRRWKLLFGEADAIDVALSVIGCWRVQEIWSAQPWQPAGHGRRRPLPSRQMLARATMQPSGQGVAS